MNPIVYNISVAAGLAMIGGGVAAAVSVPAALITDGALVIGLSVLGAILSRKG
jgi:hypothetical protein